MCGHSSVKHFLPFELQVSFLKKFTNLRQAKSKKKFLNPLRFSCGGGTKKVISMPSFLFRYDFCLIPLLNSWIRYNSIVMVAQKNCIDAIFLISLQFLSYSFVNFLNLLQLSSDGGKKKSYRRRCLYFTTIFVLLLYYHFHVLTLIKYNFLCIYYEYKSKSQLFLVLYNVYAYITHK